MASAKSSRPGSASPTQKGATLEQLDMAYKSTTKQLPAWSMAVKPKMICGDAVPSWVESIPGPKYTYDADKFKTRSPAWSIAMGSRKGGITKDSRAQSAPALPSNEAMDLGYNATRKGRPKWSLGIKPAMVIGGNVPSWTNSIPGPKYTYGLDTVKKKPPSYSMSGRLEFVVGSTVPSWVNSIPGPKYTYSADVNKKKPPQYSIAEKLPTEADLQKKRSPGPIYSGVTTDATKQSLVDSTKKRTCAPTFGIGPRWEGQTYEMALSGALCRYE
mmetsp:Transcript_106995/g.194703  ORF Transcript_106995/g.194703 Transcript_106995/m.194703 type:complete len:272 (-) Transcript_106995:36-851(-)